MENTIWITNVYNIMFFHAFHRFNSFEDPRKKLLNGRWLQAEKEMIHFTTDMQSYVSVGLLCLYQIWFVWTSILKSQTQFRIETIFFDFFLPNFTECNSHSPNKFNLYNKLFFLFHFFFFFEKSNSSNHTHNELLTRET